MKPLSDKQALACEQAREPVCRCRCGGAGHGAKRGGVHADGSIDRAFFEALQKDDPHYLPDEAARQRQVEARKVAQKRRKRIAALERDIRRSRCLEIGAPSCWESELAELKAQ